MRKHLWIPDTQVRDGVNTDHIEACGNYILEKRPDVVMIAGDWWDMPATSRWNSPREQEKLRIKDDIEAGKRAMARLWKPLLKWNKKRAGWKMKRWWPEVHFLCGNHEYHIERFIEQHPVLEGLLGYKDLGIDAYGITFHDFLKPVRIDGVLYSHYFCHPSTGRAYSGQIETRLKNIGTSFTQGHAQEFAYGERQLPDGTIHHGLVAGAFYSHFESYKTNQGNAHWRGVVMKHEVRGGQYDIMKVSLDFLLRRYL